MFNWAIIEEINFIVLNNKEAEDGTFILRVVFLVNKYFLQLLMVCNKNKNFEYSE